MATKKEKVTNVDIPEMNLQTFTLKIIGDTPLISHSWSQKAKMEILNKHLQKAKTGREIRRPMVEFADSLYWLTEKPDFNGLTDEQARDVLSEVIPKSKFGFPTSAFKAAAIDAGYQQNVLGKKTTARGAILVLGEFAELHGVPTPREDITRIAKGGTDLRYRAEFKTWSTELTIRFNAGAISLEQVVHLFKLGGFANGVGDWRPARDGSFGMFHIE